MDNIDSPWCSTYSNIKESFDIYLTYITQSMVLKNLTQETYVDEKWYMEVDWDWLKSIQGY